MYLKYVLYIGTTLAIATADVFQEFSQFQKTYGVSYGSIAEFTKRYEIFNSNYEQIKNHNALDLPWKLSINEYADLSWDEFKSVKIGTLVSPPLSENTAINSPSILPTSVNWVTKGKVTAVKNQGSCGSCWAFSTTGAIESKIAIKTGTLVSLSEQQLVDCSSSYGNQGCNGGLMTQAFQYVKDNKGLCTETSYPYTGTSGVCNTKCTRVSPISGFANVQVGDEDALAAAVVNQPVSIAIEADQSGFQFYSSGVFNGTCGTNLDHGVLAVGYGVDSSTGLKYWLVKNSWGANWGESGYIKLVRSGGKTNGQCGIAMMPSFPTV